MKQRLLRALNIQTIRSLAGVVLVAGMFFCVTDAVAQMTAKQQREVASQPCRHTLLRQSQDMIRFMLSDIDKTYTHTGGGGISSIRQTATGAYTVSILQEERVDQISYDLAVGAACEIRLLRKKVIAVSPRSGERSGERNGERSGGM